MTKNLSNDTNAFFRSAVDRAGKTRLGFQFLDRLGAMRVMAGELEIAISRQAFVRATLQFFDLMRDAPMDCGVCGSKLRTPTDCPKLGIITRGLETDPTNICIMGICSPCSNKSDAELATMIDAYIHGGHKGTLHIIEDPRAGRSH